MSSRESDVWVRALSHLREVSVVLPAYNVGKVICKVIESVTNVLESSGLRNYEVIVVNDGSTDRTLSELLKAKPAGKGVLKVITYRRNRGKGFAVSIGVANASKPYIAVMDADGDVDPRQLIYVLAPLIKYDAVVTSKWHPQSKTKASKLRRFLSHSFRSLVWALLGINARDTQAGAKAFKAALVKKAISGLGVRRYAFDVELLAKLKEAGAEILEVPSIHELTLNKPPTLRIVFSMLLELLATRYRLLLGR